MDQIYINKYNKTKRVNSIFPSPQQNKFLHQKLTHKKNKNILNSIGSSRPKKIFRHFNLKFKFNKKKLKTVNTSSNHSFQPTIKRLMIMLPLHGQNTAAL